MGIMSGMAMGGGILLVPALVFFVGTEQHVAQGVCLATFIPTAIVAVTTHARQGNVNFKLALYIIIGSVIGALIGSNLASSFSSVALKKIFGVFLVGIGIYQFIAKPKIKTDLKSKHNTIK